MQVALITGAAKRVGAQMARSLHAAGFSIIIHYRSSDHEAESLKSELELIRDGSVKLVAADLLQIKDFSYFLKDALSPWGRLDVLVNNASTFYPTRIDKITRDNWDDLIGVNLKVPLFLSLAANKYLQKTQGSIINIADIHGERPLKGHTIYSVSKAGLIMLTKSLARELGPKVRVNAIAPGAILWPENKMTEKNKQNILNDTVLKRAGDPQDIAKTVLYLIEDATYTTGQVLVIDGGRTLSN